MGRRALVLVAGAAVGLSAIGSGVSGFTASPASVTVGVGGAAASSASYQGSAIAGTDDGAGLAGQSSTLCAGPPACEQETVHLKVPAGFAGNVAITATVKSSDGGGLDIGIFDTTGKKLASNTAGTSPTSTTAGGLKAGDYIVQVDGDVATGGTYTGTVTAVALVTTAPSLSLGASNIGFTTATPTDAFRPGFEPDIADSRDGKIYSSVPNGFSTTQSFVWRSDDRGQTFHQVEGNVTGKTLDCVGGGDTQLETDPVNSAMYFVDLQGLSNFSTAVSTDQGHNFNFTCQGVNGVGVDRQWTGIDSDGGQHAVGSAGGRLYLDYDNVAQQSGANQLVMNESLDGVHYGGLCQSLPSGSVCPGTPAVISNNEGIPGDIVVDNVPGSRYQHSVYPIHTSANSGAVILSICRGAAGDTTAATVANDCTDPTRVVPGDQTRVNTLWHDVVIRQTKGRVGNLFASIAIDTKGNLYATWSEYTGGPGAIFYAASTDGGEHWSNPVQVSPPSLGNDVMPWITAGDPGRVAIAWYGAPQASEGGVFGPDQLNHGTWNVYMAETTDGLAGANFQVVQVSDHQAKFGNISTQGLGGSPDRSLGDYMQVTTGPRGEAEISYVDDTSADRNIDYCGCGQTPSEAAGPTMIIKQNQGPSLYAAVGDLGTPPLNPINSITHPAGKGFFSTAGMDIAGVPHLDVTGVNVVYIPPGTIDILMSTGDRNLKNDLGPDPTLGGTTNEWVVRWALPTPGGQGDGNIFYVAMESDAGGAPVLFDGSTGTVYTNHPAPNERGYFTYQNDHVVPGGVYDNKIDWRVPVADVGNVKLGDFLYSVQGFTSTLAGPTQPVQPNQISSRNDLGPTGNLIDETPAFTAHLGSTTQAAPQVTPQNPVPLPQTIPNTSTLEPLPAVVPAGAVVLLGLAGVALTRRRRAR